jgi:hypothetical protein
MLEVMKQIAELLSHPVEEIRVWSLMTRYNYTVRPYNCIELKETAVKTVTEVSKQDASWNVFVETSSDVSFATTFDYASLLQATNIAYTLDKQLEQLSSASPQQKFRLLPPYTLADEVMIFFKYYDPKTSKLRYVFKLYISKKTTLHAIQERVNRKMHFAPNTDLLFFEEVRMSQIKPILVFDKPLDKLAHEELLTGDIYVFQVNEKERLRSYPLPTVEDYFRYAYLNFPSSTLQKKNPKRARFKHFWYLQ